MGDKVPFKENKDVLKLDRGDGHTTLWICWKILNGTLQMGKLYEEKQCQCA